MAMIRTVSRQYLSQGNRIVESVGDRLVIKWGCPHSSKTGGQNRIEAASWERVKHLPDVTHYLQPVVASAPDGSWLLMEKVTTDTLPKDFYSKRVPELTQWAKQNGLGAMTRDIHSANVGINPHGETVVIDYGFNQDKFRQTYEREMCAQKNEPLCTYCTLVAKGRE